MSGLTQRVVPVAGLLLAAFASIVAVRTWLGERSLAEGRAAQQRGLLDAATAAYRAASGYGNADAATERARLELLRRDWAGALESLREARALAPTRGVPHLLQAQLDMAGPGLRDAAREERILASCEIASTLEPNSDWIKRECGKIARSLEGRREGRD